MAPPDKPHSTEKEVGRPSSLEKEVECPCTPEKEEGRSPGSAANHVNPAAAEAQPQSQRREQSHLPRRRFSEVARPRASCSRTTGEPLRPLSNECAPIGEINGGRPTLATLTSPPSTSEAQSQLVQSIPPLFPRRNRWDQPPPPAPTRCCPDGEARLIMTCCRAKLCRDCALVNPCGCREWQERRGYAVPMFPQFPIPDNCNLDRLVMLDYPMWLRIHASRGGEDVRLIYICLEDLIHRPEAVIISQVHCYKTVGRSWSRFYCYIYQGKEKIRQLCYPPISSEDKEDFEELVDKWRELRRIRYSYSS